MKELIDYLKGKGFLERENVYNAFSEIDRKDFIPEELKKYAYEDMPLSIGYGQTISQPQVVAFMIKLLSPEREQTVLDIGFGSGWTTAILAEIVKTGKVIGVEKVPEVYNFGKKNIEKYNFINKKTVELFLGDGRKGKADKGPYDRILVSAADRAKDLPQNLTDQIKDGGRIVIPIDSSIFLFIKKKGIFQWEEYPGFSFVPLV